MKMALLVYMLGTLTSLSCAFLLLRGYASGRKRLLLWSGLCFACLTVSNMLVWIDLVMLPDMNLYMLRLGSALIGMALLLYGLIWEG